MSGTRLLIGSLSNDLYRAANLIQRQSYPAALRFIQETKRWTKELEGQPVKNYIKKIITQVENMNQSPHLTMEMAEKFLMYSILLQNYALHLRE